MELLNEKSQTYIAFSFDPILRTPLQPSQDITVSRFQGGTRNSCVTAFLNLRDCFPPCFSPAASTAACPPSFWLPQEPLPPRQHRPRLTQPAALPRRSDFNALWCPPHFFIMIIYHSLLFYHRVNKDPHNLAVGPL